MSTAAQDNPTSPSLAPILTLAVVLAGCSISYELLIEFARTNEVLRRVNRDVFSDPRVHTTITDGYQFVRHTDERYDAIYIDFPIANTYDLAKLYSREFYEFVGQRLRPRGYAVFDSSNTVMFMPEDEDGNRELMKVNPWPIYSNTLMQAGFETIVPFFTTLEANNPEVARRVEALRFTLPPSREAEIAKMENPARRILQRRKEIRELNEKMAHMTSDYLKQGFIFMSSQALPETMNPDLLPKDLRVLNPQRLSLAQTADLVLPRHIDPRRVNSIIRPTLPVTPWWQPMTSH